MTRKAVVAILTIAVTIAAAASVVVLLVNHSKASAEEILLENVVEHEVADTELASDTDLDIMQLTCLADSQQEAEQIAQSYGIEFVSFEYGVAVFLSDKPYPELVAYGEENGLKQLSVDYEQTILYNNSTKEFSE